MRQTKPRRSKTLCVARTWAENIGSNVWNCNKKHDMAKIGHKGYLLPYAEALW